MDWCKVVGENVRRLRLAKGMSQEELSFVSGLHRTYVSGVERGKRNPTVVVIAQLAEALETEPAKILDKPKAK